MVELLLHSQTQLQNQYYILVAEQKIYKHKQKILMQDLVIFLIGRIIEYLVVLLMILQIDVLSIITFIDMEVEQQLMTGIKAVLDMIILD